MGKKSNRQWIATHKLACPAGDATFTIASASNASQEDADDRAERIVYQMFNEHVKLRHPEWTS
jgi:hypothetical protein